MSKYILGFLMNLFNPAVSLFSWVDSKSLISKKAKIYFGTKIYNSTIDSFSYIGPKTEIVYSDIGKFCSIANNCSIGLASHSLNNISTSPIFTSKKSGTGYSWSTFNTYEESHRVNIGNDVWIGTKSIIMGGIKIGDGAIIGAGAIVTKDVPSYSIVAGIPAKVIKYRFDEQIIQKMLELQWWNASEDFLKKNIKIFQRINIKLEDLDDFRI
jgi:acetyltransferase-like isoleucine patch superfamily enzyme